LLLPGRWRECRSMIRCANAAESADCVGSTKKDSCFDPSAMACLVASSAAAWSAARWASISYTAPASPPKPNAASLRAALLLNELELEGVLKEATAGALLALALAAAMVINDGAVAAAARLAVVTVALVLTKLLLLLVELLEEVGCAGGVLETPEDVEGPKTEVRPRAVAEETPEECAEVGAGDRGVGGGVVNAGVGRATPTAPALELEGTGAATEPVIAIAVNGFVEVKLGDGAGAAGTEDWCEAAVAGEEPEAGKGKRFLVLNANGFVGNEAILCCV